MKKRVAMLLAVLMLAALAGCRRNTLLNPRRPVTLSFWHIYGEQADSPMNQLVEAFNATVGNDRGVVVSVTNVTSSSKIAGQVMEAVEDVPGALEPPDLFSAHTATALALGAERLVNWETQFTQEELAGFVPQFLSDGRLDGSLAVLPLTKSTYVLCLNGSQFARFSADTGVTCDELATWDGFFDAAARYYDWSGGKPFCALDYLIRHIELDVLSKRGEMTYTESGWYDPDDPFLREAYLRFAGPLAQGHIVVSDAYANTQVMTGETLAGIGSSAAVSYYNDVVTYPDNTSEPMALMVLPLPKTEYAEQFMPITGAGLAALRTTAQKAEAAALFVRWLTEAERNLSFAADTGYLPVRTAAFDAIEDYSFSEPEYAELFSAIRRMQEEYTPVVRPDFDGYYDRVEALYAALRERRSALRERADAGEPVEELAEELWTLFLSV